MQNLIAEYEHRVLDHKYSASNCIRPSSFVIVINKHKHIDENTKMNPILANFSPLI